MKFYISYILMLSVYGVFWPQNLCLGNTCGFNHLNVVWASFGAIPLGKNQNTSIIILK